MYWFFYEKKRIFWCLRPVFFFDPWGSKFSSDIRSVSLDSSWPSYDLICNNISMVYIMNFWILLDKNQGKLVKRVLGFLGVFGWEVFLRRAKHLFFYECKFLKLLDFDFIFDWFNTWLWLGYYSIIRKIIFDYLSCIIIEIGL